MMTSSNGNIFRVTGHLCGEFTGEFPLQRPVTRSFDIFFDLRLNKLLSTQSWGWWCETPSRPLWHHSNDFVIFLLFTYKRYPTLLCDIPSIQWQMVALTNSQHEITHSLPFTGAERTTQMSSCHNLDIVLNKKVVSPFIVKTTQKQSGLTVARKNMISYVLYIKVKK